MTRELDIDWTEMSRSSKRAILRRNGQLLHRMREKYSYREIEKLTTIPRQTLRDFINGRKSESLCKRTLGNEPTDNDNGDNLGVDVTELSKRLKEVGQNVE